MQIASRQPLWNGGGRGTFIEFEMTPETGLYVQLFVEPASPEGGAVEWGDGETSEYRSAERGPVEHTYRLYGHYKARLHNIRKANFRLLDGDSQYPFDAAITSFVDYDNIVTGVDSGGFKLCVNLERVWLPAVTGVGQRPFADCYRLREAYTPLSAYFFDGAYENCESLEKLELGGGTMWSNVFYGCTSLREIRFTHVDQISNGCFGACPALGDIWMGDKTIAQTKQESGDGDVIAGYGARFPWDANPTTRFHCLDGTVLGNGTVIG